MDQIFEFSLLALLIVFMALPFLQNLLGTIFRKPGNGDEG